MKKFMILILILINGNLFAEYGMSSFPVLMQDNYSAQALAMGNSLVSLGNSADSIFSSPAGIANISDMSVYASRLNWLYDTTFHAIAYAMPIPGEAQKAGSLGLSGAMFSINDFTPTIDGSVSGESGGADLFVGLTYANNIFRPFDQALSEKVHLDLGLTVRYVQAQLASYTASDLAFDVGMTYGYNLNNISQLLSQKEPDNRKVIITNTNSAGELEINTRIESVGETVEADNESDSFQVAFAFRSLAVTLRPFYEGGEVNAPWYFDFGMSYALLRDSRHELILSASTQKPSDGNWLLSTGLQYAYKETIYLRGGYKILSRESEGLSFGIGLNFEVTDWLAFRADYTVLNPLKESSDMISLSVVF